MRSLGGCQCLGQKSPFFLHNYATVSLYFVPLKNLIDYFESEELYPDSPGKEIRARIVLGWEGGAYTLRKP